MALTEEKMKYVQNHIPTIALISAYYKRFGDDALNVANEYAYQMGMMMGQQIKGKMNIKDDDVNAVSTALSAFLSQATGIEILPKVEGDKIKFINEGFCPIMEAVKMLDAPWDKICPNYSWRVFEGIAAAINPNVKMEVPKSRIRGDECCYHVITVPK